ncbi:Transcriptional regulator, DeoR family [Candidatus Rhodobacter oscarellae]|uniref:Transcriptional regulator, DeoR family n=1 Tax=Candidatus Rhodobacter oscarellae TaxID=1675527 RepID=A0A0J9E6P5_9RHOB|nr:YafY family protein [Candidatus Rhodobacter lobularis]KMW58362.1 Transcriptional regulator, DeoR family [Candidatus Rhodobacter lobularis]
MRRSDRLIAVVQIMREGRLFRAQDIATRLGVTVRTIYRDMDTLMASGLPIEGARGLGYRITAEITLPPLNLTMTELEALHFGMAVVGEAADDELKAAAASLSAKIDAVLPEDRRAPPTGWGFAVYPFADAAKGFQHMPGIRGAIRARQKLRLVYQSLDGAVTTRTVRPLELEYWGRVWTATCWCELRDDFRVLRVDRIDALQVLPALFVEEDGKRLEDYAARLEQEEKPSL